MHELYLAESIFEYRSRIRDTAAVSAKLIPFCFPSAAYPALSPSLYNLLLKCRQKIHLLKMPHWIFNSPCHYPLLSCEKDLEVETIFGHLPEMRRGRSHFNRRYGRVTNF